MIYLIYLRTFYVPYQRVDDIFHSLDEVNEYLDNVEDYTDYLIVGYGKNMPTYTSMGKIDRPAVKRLVKH